jgi:hypothetical protein
MSTMARILSEDENPQILAWFYLKYHDEEEFQFIPVNTGPPEFVVDRADAWSSDPAKTTAVWWHFELFTPERPCSVRAVKVEFIGYDDIAIRPVWAECDYDEDGEMDTVRQSYHISCDHDDEDVEVEGF